MQVSAETFVVFTGKCDSPIGEGLESILVSAVLFTIFGSLFGDIFGRFPFRIYLPFALIALGVFMFIRALLQPVKRIRHEPRE
jgi:hypothetical protein